MSMPEDHCRCVLVWVSWARTCRGNSCGKKTAPGCTEAEDVEEPIEEWL